MAPKASFTKVVLCPSLALPLPPPGNPQLQEGPPLRPGIQESPLQRQPGVGERGNSQVMEHSLKLPLDPGLVECNRPQGPREQGDQEEAADEPGWLRPGARPAQTPGETGE